MGIGNWLSIASTVAEVSAQVLPLIIAGVGEEGAEDGTGAYVTGDIEWYPDPSLNIIAYNRGDVDATLNYLTSSADENDQEVFKNHCVVLPPHFYYLATDDLSTYRDGQLSIAPLNTSQSSATRYGADDDEEPERVTSYVKWLAIGTTALVAGGITLAILRSSDGLFRAVFTNLASRLSSVKWSLSLTALGATAALSGEATFATTSSGDGEEPQEWTVDFPQGFKPDPSAQNIQVDLQMTYATTQAKSPSMVKQGRPAPLRRRRAA